MYHQHLQKKFYRTDKKNSFKFHDSAPFETKRERKKKKKIPKIFSSVRKNFYDIFNILTSQGEKKMTWQKKNFI